LRGHHHRYQPGRGAQAASDRRGSRARRVLRAAHPIPATQVPAAGVVTAYKSLKYVERDFRHIKSDDLDLRPVFHRLEERVKAHVLICMLACYLTWHLRRAWAPLTFTDEDPPVQDNPVTPAHRSPAAQAKASRQRDEYGQISARMVGESATCRGGRRSSPGSAGDGDRNGRSQRRAP